MINKKGFEFSFGWIFAIIVGSVIIFLAVYAVSNIARSEKLAAESSAAKELGILLNPVETNLESGKLSGIKFNEETRIFNGCKTIGNFGEQEISIATKSGIGEEWSKGGVASTFYNKYLFSASTVEGEEMIVFSKPFSMPFKIADLVYIWPAEQEYCFADPPESVKEEIESLNPKNVNITDDKKKCRKNSIEVCFEESGCEIDVNVQAQIVKKNRQNLHYGAGNNYEDENALLYGAIFSEPGIYECQVKRLMQRASELALLYRAKSEFLSPKGCSSNLEAQLVIYANTTRAINSSLSSDMKRAVIYAKELRRSNDALSCKLF